MRGGEGEGERGGGEERGRGREGEKERGGGREFVWVGGWVEMCECVCVRERERQCDTV